MAKKKDETEVKATAKAKSTEKAAAKPTAKSTAKTKSKVTPVVKAAADNKAKDSIKMAEHGLANSCQNMLSSIVTWSMDALMYSNILLIRRKMNMSMEEAAAVLNVDMAELANLMVVYNAYCKTSASERADILGKYSDRIGG